MQRFIQSCVDYLWKSTECANENYTKLITFYCKCSYLHQLLTRDVRTRSQTGCVSASILTLPEKNKFVYRNVFTF